MSAADAAKRLGAPVVACPECNAIVYLGDSSEGEYHRLRKLSPPELYRGSHSAVLHRVRSQFSTYWNLPHGLPNVFCSVACAASRSSSLPHYVPDVWRGPGTLLLRIERNITPQRRK